jgi:hypothetical protein
LKIKAEIKGDNPSTSDKEGKKKNRRKQGEKSVEGKK